MQSHQRQIDDANILIARLERLSADSVWAHRASGLRGSLLRQVESVQEQQNAVQEDRETLAALMSHAFWILEQAAKEIPADKR